MSPEAYRARLLEPLRPLAREALATVQLPSRVWFEPARTGVDRKLEDLYEIGVECGHTATRRVLAHSVVEADQRIDAMHGEIGRLEYQHRSDTARIAEVHHELEQVRAATAQHALEIEADLRRARERITTLETSTFWRMTYPMRAAIHGLKVGVRKSRSAAHQAHLLRPRLATARQIAREQGIAELGRRVVAKMRARGHGSQAGIVARAGLEPAIGPLDIATSAQPVVSVVIPSYGQHLHTFTCLKALAREAASTPIEIMVMDDCAPEPAAEALAGVKGVRFVRNAHNLGFLGNTNAGVTLARGEYVLLLNNDAVVGPGCIEALLRIFEARKDAGAAGAKLVYPDGTLQEAGAIVWRDGSAWNDGRGGNPDAPEFNYVREADYCSAACLLVRRDVLERLGGFDSRYAPAYCEDTDLCFRIRETGLKVYYQPAAEAVHFEGVSHGTSTGAGIKRYQVENQAKFFERWKTTLARHRPNGLMPRLERDRGARRRVLFVEACMLTPDQDSGSVRTWNLIEIMQELGCKVTFVAENLERRQPYTAQLQQSGVEVLYGPHVGSIRTLIEERGAEFDVIILARYYVAAPYIAAVRKHAPQALLVLDTIDLHFLRQRRLAALNDDRAVAQSAEQIRRQEMDCIARSDVTWVVSEVEQELLANEMPQARVLVQSNVHDSLERIPGFAEREGMLFVGGYRHPPNVDAALHLARDIAPLVAGRLPGVKIYLAGSNAPRAVLDLQGPNLEILGFVPDIESWLDRCRLSISPLRYGAGVKGKVNQAMSRGVPVVATSPSVEGMHLTAGEEVLTADDAASFADAIVRAYTDEALWNRLSRGGLANVERHFSRDVARRGLEELFALADRRAR